MSRLVACRRPRATAALRLVRLVLALGCCATLAAPAFRVVTIGAGAVTALEIDFAQDGRPRRR